MNAIIRPLIIGLALTLFVNEVGAIPAAKLTAKQQEVEHTRELLQQIVDVNLRYKDKFYTILSESTLEQQTPHATVILCSDSRVDTDILSDTPTGQMFVIRNIGNQLDTAYGSVEYGVEHLDTELLLIVGHSRCGAIKAAMHDYNDSSPNLKAELDTLEVNPAATLNQNLVHNVNNQVKHAVETFSKKIKDNQLVVIGMIYDMHNDFKLGSGQLILVNINNQTDPRVLQQNEYVKGLKNLVVMGRGY